MGLDPVAGVDLHHEVTGDGPDVVFIHAGIADSRMWDPQWASFDGFRRIRLDLRGFGGTPVGSPPPSHARDVAGLMDELDVSSATFIGASMGGRVALELAIARPDLVAALVLAGTGLPGLDCSADVRAYGEAEDEAVRRGDLDGATELNMRMWVDGPQREPADVDPAVREAMREMQRRALELQAPFWDELDEDLLVEGVADRLGEIDVPTLVLVGELDVADIRAVAARLSSEIAGARSATIAHTAHVPNLERPADFDAVVLAFLADIYP